MSPEIPPSITPRSNRRGAASSAHSHGYTGPHVDSEAPTYEIPIQDLLYSLKIEDHSDPSTPSLDDLKENARGNGLTHVDQEILIELSSS